MVSSLDADHNEPQHPPAIRSFTSLQAVHTHTHTHPRNHPHTHTHTHPHTTHTPHTHTHTHTTHTHTHTHTHSRNHFLGQQKILPCRPARRKLISGESGGWTFQVACPECSDNSLYGHAMILVWDLFDTNTSRADVMERCFS